MNIVYIAFYTGNNAVSRLMRDLKEWTKSKDEYPCIDAIPLEDNILEWHCNISPESGHFQGLIFHIILIFNTNYPVEPPKVQLVTSIPHANVFGEWICLDMIKKGLLFVCFRLLFFCFIFCFFGTFC